MSEYGNNSAQGAAPGKGRGFLGGCAFGCFLSLLLAVGLPVVVVMLTVCKIGSMFEAVNKIDDSSKQRTTYECVWRWGDGGTNSAKIARIAIEGAIERNVASGALFFSNDDYQDIDIISKIKFATDDDDVKGIWLDVDSPGGEVVLSDEIRHLLELFKASAEGRFVFARFGTLACSGGYYVSTAADKIMAEPSTLTGSIGVIMSTVNAAGLAEKLGVKSVNIVSAENKAILDPLSPVTSNHVALIQKTVDEDFERFLGFVSKSRNLPKDELLRVADGRILSATQALEAKLIDAIGYEDDALKMVEEMAKSAFPDTDGVKVYWLKRDGASLWISDGGLFSAANALLGLPRGEVRLDAKLPCTY